MPASPIIVDNELFLGRVEEQKQFRSALADILDSPDGEDLPYVILLYGDGGMGKTTLAKRFRDIARMEPTFEGEFDMLWVDWEDERRRSASLQVGREHISTEAVFDIIHAVAVRQRMGGQFGSYQSAVKQRGEAEKKIAEALSAGSEHDEFAALRGAGATAIAKILRAGAPMMGATGEKVVQAFLDAGIRVGAGQAAEIRAALETHLRARLKPEQFDVYLNPDEQLARTLAEGLSKVAASKPLLVFLDTYEIIDRVDIWLRVTVRAAGPRVVWIVGGRNNLVRSGQFGAEYFKGYADEFPRRLLAYDMRQLAIEDIRTLFADAAPERPLTEPEVEALSRATRGVPLAIREAAEMWVKGVALIDIISEIDDSTPRGQIVQKMTARYLLHAVAESDKQALFALALSQGDVEILRAMLRPADGSAFDLDTLLHRLERDYASVHAERARLHDEPAFFFREHLKDQVHRTEDRIRILNERAVDALRVRLKMLETDLPRIEDRWQDDDWTKATLDLTEYLFWLDESQGWHWLVPRLVESSVYKLELWRGLVEIPNNWVNYLGYVGKKRLKCLRSSMTLFRRIFKNAPEGTLEAESEFIEEFTRLERSGWLKGDDEDEHRAMLDLLRGNFLCHRGLYKKALAQYEIVESRLPVRGELLRKRLAEAYSTLGWILDDEGYYEEAIAILQHAIELDSEDITLLDELGGMYADSDHTEEAINIFRHAIELNPEDSSLYYSLALALRDAQQFDEAIETCVHILKLESNDLDALNGLGYLYIQTGDMTKAELYLEKALQTKPLFALSLLNLGIVKWRTGRIDAAKTLFSDALNKIRAHADTEKATLGWLQVVTGDIESGLQNIRQALEKNASAVDKSNMRDWTNALVIAASPPEGLEQILEIVKDTRTNR